MKSIFLISNDGWRDGVFKTICNITVREEELNIDYGFESPNAGAIITKEEIDKLIYELDLIFQNTNL